MRPYQISATERILSKIQLANNYKWVGKIDAGGYIWHTTGSGKTLTSFKTAQLASQLDYIDKVLFVVDRKDLDSQTQKEYDRFSKGSANGNTSTKILKAQLEDRYENKSKIIITTIQKLGHFIKQNKNHEVFKKNIVLIFDECHRSQFGELHLAITKTFKNYFMFGFTGTPIFPKNSNGSSKTLFKTTEQTFGDKLHTYTIVNAINDGNVLPFRIDYINTIKEKENIQDKKVNAIDIEKAMSDPNRIREVVSYIAEHFEQKTMRNKHYELKEQRLSGFNSIFAVSSIPVAKKYYLEFKKQLEEKNKNLTIATIFSYSANEEENTDNLDDESFDTENLDLICTYSDIIQIGARNMQNFSLLKKLGKINKPVLLKRGLSATINEFLLSAEYIIAHGNREVILCERGIRTFETMTRNTLDINAIAMIKELSHLPIIVDASHGTGRRSLVEPITLAGIFAGAY